MEWRQPFVNASAAMERARSDRVAGREDVILARPAQAVFWAAFGAMHEEVDVSLSTSRLKGGRPCGDAASLKLGPPARRIRSYIN